MERAVPAANQIESGKHLLAILKWPARAWESNRFQLWAKRLIGKKTAADDQPPFPVFFEFCSEGGTRTRDTTIMSRVL